MFKLHDVFTIGLLPDSGLLSLNLPVVMSLLELELPSLDNLVQLLLINNADLEAAADDRQQLLQLLDILGRVKRLVEQIAYHCLRHIHYCCLVLGQS